MDGGWEAEPLFRWTEPRFVSCPSVVEKLCLGFDLGHYSLPLSLLSYVLSVYVVHSTVGGSVGTTNMNRPQCLEARRATIVCDWVHISAGDPEEG